MSTDTDKLQALNNALEEILSEPSSPPTFFDEEPCDAAQASEQVAKASDNPRRGTKIPNEHFGKSTSRGLGISPKEIAHIVCDAENESPGMARQPAVSDNRISVGGWALRGFAGILLAAGIGVAAVIWLVSSGDASKTAPSQPAPLAQTGPTAAVSSEVTPLLQSMARDLSSVEKEIEQLKVGRELLVRDNANLSEQLKASQEQLTRAVARLSEQLKGSQEQVADDNAKMVEQIRGIQEQLTGFISRAAEQNVRPKIAATPPRPTLPSPRSAVLPERKPGPTLSSAQVAAQPKAEKPKSASTARPPAPAR
jgi:hypothetical protein